MWKINVPKILHVYWGGERLPYMRFLTVTSFMKYNPDFDIVLWIPERVSNKISWRTGENDYKLTCKDFTKELLNLPIHKKYIDFNTLGFRSDTSEVHKADYIRINAMSLCGGIWSDMDIIYFKPVKSLNLNNDSNKDKDTFVCISGYGHSTGFIMSSGKSEFFNVLRDNLSKELNPSLYQCIGPTMFNKYFPKIESIPNGCNIPFDVVYKYNASMIDELFMNKKPNFENSIGCHWYGGYAMWEDFINETNGGLANLPPSIISSLL